MKAMRKLTLLLSLALLPGLFPAVAQDLGDDALKRALKARADAWDVAIWSKDRKAIAENMSASFVQIDSDGNLADKRKFVEEITADALVIAPYAVEDFTIRLYGDTAVLNGSTRMQGTYEGKPFTSHYRFTDVYVKEGGAWRVVNIQTTRIK